MSHLSTVITRVENKVKAYGDDRDGLKRDTLFLQAVCNLREYQDAWTDQTKKEVERADELFYEYKNLLVGTPYQYPRS